MNAWETKRGRQAQFIIKASWGLKGHIRLSIEKLRDKARKWLQRRNYRVYYDPVTRKYWCERWCKTVHYAAWGDTRRLAANYDAALIAAIHLATGGRNG